MTSDHFQGRNVPDHLKEARAKGAFASAELHGTEMPGHWAAAADSLKETTLALLILWVVFSGFDFSPSLIWRLLLLFSCGWFLWKLGRSAILGWSRLERVHRLMEEERYEIEHHREQERLELTEMYRAKGFSGKLLEEVIDVLMADDNRLLQIMMEEELGVPLESYEHPLKQGVGAGLGVLVVGILSLVSFWISPAYGIPIISCLLLIAGASATAKIERNQALTPIIWSLAIAILSGGITYFLTSLYRHLPI